MTCPSSISYLPSPSSVPTRWPSWSLPTRVARLRLSSASRAHRPSTPWCKAPSRSGLASVACSTSPTWGCCHRRPTAGATSPIFTVPGMASRNPARLFGFAPASTLTAGPTKWSFCQEVAANVGRREPETRINSLQTTVSVRRLGVNGGEEGPRRVTATPRPP